MRSATYVIIPLLSLVAAACQVQGDEWEATREAVQSVPAPEPKPYDPAADQIDEFLNNPQLISLPYSDGDLFDGYLATVQKLDGMDFVVEFDMEPLPPGRTISFAGAQFFNFEFVENNFAMPAGSAREAADRIADRIGTRTFCSRPGSGTDGGSVIAAQAAVSIDGVDFITTAHLARFPAGSTNTLATWASSEPTLFGLDIGIWSTDCKRANNCSAPDCSADILGVIVTGYCSWFESLWGGISCRCIVN